MKSAIFIAIGSAIALVLVGSFLLDTYKRRNRRANPTRHHSQRRWGGPHNAGETGGNYDERDQGGDWGSDGGGGDSGGGDSGGGGSD
jgi:uncharacterized membrane protein YgcG